MKTSFNKNLTYQNSVGNNTIECYQLTGYDNITFDYNSTNLTYCTGTGGHGWWSKDPDSMVFPYTGALAPNNLALDVSDQVVDFVCTNGANCKSYSKGKKGSVTMMLVVICLLVCCGGGGVAMKKKGGQG